MSQSIAIDPSSYRFFYTFQRYMTSSARSFHETHCTRSAYPRRLGPTKARTPTLPRYASTTTHTSPPPPPDTRTHYSLFPKTLPEGPPPRGVFAVDPTILRREFLQLQSLAHPDRHSGANKQKAEGTSALINEAYKTLQDPLRRAQYLLSLRGIDIAEDERAKTDDMELLEEVMEVRSLIEGAEEEGELEETRKRNERRIMESVEVLDDAFRRDDLEAAKIEAVRLRYWTNIKESLDSWERGKPVILVH